MGTKAMTKEQAQEAVRLVEECYAAGYAERGNPSAKSEAARIAIERGIVRTDSAFRDRLRNAKQTFNLEPKQPKKAGKKVEIEPADLVRVRRQEEEVRAVRRREKGLLDRIADLEDLRGNVLGIVSQPLRPQLEIPSESQPPGGAGRRSIVLHLTDVHFDEDVNAEEMDGVNSYNRSIAKRRLGRYFGTTIALGTKHWTGTPPSEVILCLGGDLISGEIHNELTETNNATAFESTRAVAEAISGGIIALREKIGAPMRIYAVPGNHGRTTRKPQSKKRAIMSFDSLAVDLMELMVQNAGYKDITFYRTNSPDAYFSTFGYHWLLNHGDTMGSKGGQGFIGAAATIIRGHRKLMDTSLRQGKMIHYLLTGHFHTTVRTPFGWAGGSVVGYSEYSRDGRMDPEPAKQWMLVVHEKLGVIDEKEIYLGAPEEGSHYLGPASFIRPNDL